MALTTSVIVRGVTNLSDARYCAGMGVDILGFGFEEGQANYVTPETYTEISNWVAGVSFGGAFYTAEAETINALASEHKLDYILLEKQYLIDDINQIDKPVIQKVYINKDTNETELTDEMQLYKPHVHAFLLLSDDFTDVSELNEKFLKNMADNFPLYVGFGITKENVKNVLSNIHPKGIAMLGGKEIRPGYKNFDNLQDVLEEIED